MLNVVASELSDVAVAVIVTEPASAPPTVLVARLPAARPDPSLGATPPEAVALPSPPVVPAPLVFANVTLVALSLVTRLPPASRISIVSVRDVPDARLAHELVNVR